MSDEGQAIVCNIGHFDNEIHGPSSSQVRVGSTSSRRSTIIFPDGQRIILLAEGRLVNLGCATGHPSFVMSNSFTNQVLAQIELFTKPEDYENRRLRAAQAPRRGGRPLHLDKLGAKLTELSQEQADYIGVPVEGPLQARALPLLICVPTRKAR
jgi:adenosylhomocysteinase